MYRQTRTKVVQALIVVLCLAGIFGGVDWTNTRPAHAVSAIPQENNGLALTPFMGWSTWNFIGNAPTQAKVLQQAQALKNSGLAAAGYNYVLLDDFWYLNPQTTVDANGYWAPDTSKFPGGLASMASQIHAMGLKFGAYLTPGVPIAAVNQRKPIVGTSYTADQIANTSSKEINYNFGNTSYYIDYSKPGAQAYINGWAKQLASWGVDFLKIDGVGTWDIPDVQAWSSALKNSGRDIVFDLSNNLAISNASTWQANSNAWRTQGDVECYCSTLVNWNNVASRFSSAASWAQYGGPGGWNDLDAMDVADGARDGITNTERQTYMTLWAMANSPMYLGDDLTTMDSYGKSLLTNSSVIAVDQSGHPAHPVSQASSQQVWFAKLGDGSYNVALFNLGSSTATVSASWSSLGFSGSADVRDLWSQSDLGMFSGSFSASVPSHGSRLLKVTPGGVTPTPTPTHTPTVTPTPGTTPTPTSTPVSGASCSVHYAITNQWQGGFGASLTITNTSSTAINGWTLKFSFSNGQTISQLWNGSVTQSGSAVTVTNASYNASIPPGQVVSSAPGFNGTWNGTNASPTSFTLNGSACSVV